VSRILHRLAWSLVVIWGVVSVAFVINDLLPGDPARMAAGAQARPADVARIRSQLGLDRPPLAQYGSFWRRLVHIGPRDRDSDAAHASCLVLARVGRSAAHIDFGKSFQLHQPVGDVVCARMGKTFVLAIAGVCLQLAMGVAAGVFAALRPASRVDRGLVASTSLVASVPTFLVGLLLQYVLAYRLRWLPLDGFGDTLAEHTRCLVLPALTLGLYGAGYYTRIVRDEMRVAMHRDWIRTARAKGAPMARVVLRHALRDAAVPVVTAAGLDFGALMGGAVVTETVFRWPGLGDLSVNAALNRDGPVVLACVIVTSIAVVASNVVVDLVCAALDPRQR
jgi:peptide/nickel transport system permease protein